MENLYRSGHRQRLRMRFNKGGDAAVADYELLEMILFNAYARQDVKPLAKALLNKFQTLGGVVQAPIHELLTVNGIGEAAAASIKAVECLFHRVLKEEFMDRPVASSTAQVLRYCQATMAHLRKEQHRILFLNRQNHLIAEEIQPYGTIDQTPLYPREILHKALNIGASGIILIHNHPSGDPTPSHADKEITQRIKQTLEPSEILFHDHIIIGGDKHISMRAHDMM